MGRKMGRIKYRLRLSEYEPVGAEWQNLGKGVSACRIGFRFFFRFPAGAIYMANCEMVP